MTVPVVNLDRARFDCTFGRGCEGVCCRNGRPPVYPDEAQRIDALRPRVLPLLRPEARAVVEGGGWLSRRRKAGQPMARVAGGWCVFFNRGCVLHRLGEADGDALRYKPGVCAVFPLALDDRGRWHVRQTGYPGEIWDLACLDPETSAVPAAVSLKAEIALLATWAQVGDTKTPRCADENGAQSPPGEAGICQTRRGRPRAVDPQEDGL